MSTENFTGKAEAYAKGRPGYPKAAIETIFELAPSGTVFADIGAGMGKFTVKLAERGYPVFAVEPNADMRGQLAITLAPFPNAKIMDGTAEATTLPNRSAIFSPSPMRYTGSIWMRSVCEPYKSKFIEGIRDAILGFDDRITLLDDIILYLARKP